MSIILKYWNIILILLLFIAVGLTFNSVVKLRKDNQRLKANQENLTALHEREITVKDKEYNDLNASWKDKLDSVIKVKDLKIKDIQEATIIQTAYKDTAKKPVIHGTPIIDENPIITSNPVLGEQYYKIPVEQNTKCWGMKGFVNSTDPNSQLEITERTGLNSVQLIVVRKRFLGFLWYNGKTDFKAFSDCGNVDVTKINYQKK